MNAFQQGYIQALIKLGFNPHSGVPEQEILDAGYQRSGEGKFGPSYKHPKGGKPPVQPGGFGKFMGRAGGWIGRNPLAAAGIGAAGLLGAGAIGHATGDK